MKSRKTVMVLSVLLALNLILSAGIIGFLVWDRQEEPGFDRVSKYTIYIGTNDKDTYTQKIPTEEARRIVDEICEERLDGYTSSEARGFWKDETGTGTTENSLVYSFSGVSYDTLADVMDEILTALNQNSILVEHDLTSTQYYCGQR